MDELMRVNEVFQKWRDGGLAPGCRLKIHGFIVSTGDECWIIEHHPQIWSKEENWRMLQKEQAIEVCQPLFPLFGRIFGGVGTIFHVIGEVCATGTLAEAETSSYELALVDIEALTVRDHLGEVTDSIVGDIKVSAFPIDHDSEEYRRLRENKPDWPSAASFYDD